jgi:hypothetical protein
MLTTGITLTAGKIFANNQEKPAPIALTAESSSSIL